MATLDETRLVGFIEAVFSLEIDEQRWLEQVLSALNALCGSEHSPSPSELLVCRRLAANLAGAFRCRQQPGRLETGASHPQAPDNDAPEQLEQVVSAAREQLRSAPALLDAPTAKAKRQTRGNAASISHLPGRAGLTLLHTFEENGHRYIVARENDAYSLGVAALTGREREIVEHASHGYTNKQIAYNLGISNATVRVLMARAAGRIGVRTRRELLAHPALREMRPAAQQA